MPNLFDITTATTLVRLTQDRKGQASYTVYNASGAPVRGRVVLKAEDMLVLPWLALQGRAESDFGIGEVRQFTIDIGAPPNAASGRYTFRLDALDVENPDEAYVAGPAVTFETPAPLPTPPPAPWWKKIPWWVYAAIAGGILLIVIVVVLLTRPREPAGLIANYPLRDNTNDVSGHFSPITLENAPYRDGGIECNGINKYSGDPNYCHAESPQLTSLDFNNFTIAATFKPAEIREMPVFVGGVHYGWIGFYLRQDKRIGLKISYDQTIDCGGQYQAGKWYKGMITYANGMARLYLDGRLICTQSFPLYYANDYTVGLSDFSTGFTFKGILKDLKVYNEVLTP